jgi:hypothetical protein
LIFSSEQARGHVFHLNTVSAVVVLALFRSCPYARGDDSRTASSAWKSPTWTGNKHDILITKDKQVLVHDGQW